jgi:hypothetical protein
MGVLHLLRCSLPFLSLPLSLQDQAWDRPSLSPCSDERLY